MKQNQLIYLIVTEDSLVKGVRLIGFQFQFLCRNWTNPTNQPIRTKNNFLDKCLSLNLEENNHQQVLVSQRPRWLWLAKQAHLSKQEKRDLQRPRWQQLWATSLSICSGPALHCSPNDNGPTLQSQLTIATILKKNPGEKFLRRTQIGATATRI
jgi:hypothetical protein